jgi:TolB-like protein
MKKTTQITLLLATFIFANAQEKLVEATANLLAKAQKNKTLAVLPLESRISDDRSAGQTASEVIVSVAKAQGFKLVERAQLAKMMEEQNLAASGLVNEESAIEVGNLLSAQTLVMGSVAELMGDRLITLKLMDAETGEVLNSQTVSLGPDAFKQMQKELLGESTQTSAVVFRSALIPGWGQMYADKTTRGAIWLTSFLGSVVLVSYGIFDHSSRFDEYTDTSNLIKKNINDPDKASMLIDCGSECGTLEDVKNPELNKYITEQANKKHDDYSSAYNRTLVYGAILGTVWVANVVDAWIVGSERKQKMDLYFGALPNIKGGVDLHLAYNF